MTARGYYVIDPTTVLSIAVRRVTYMFITSSGYTNLVKGAVVHTIVVLSLDRGNTVVYELQNGFKQGKSDSNGVNYSTGILSQSSRYENRAATNV